MEFLLRVCDPVALIRYKLRREDALKKDRKTRSEERQQLRRKLLRETFVKMALPGTNGE